MRKSAYSVAIVGATGLVGSEIVKALEERQFPLADLRLYSSLRNAGDEIRCGSVTARVDPLDGARFDDVDIVFFAAGLAVSAEWVPRATEAGAVVVDLTPLFADDPDVPVIVPEVNAADVAGYTTRGALTSPDPGAIALAVALNPLHTAGVMTRVVATCLEPVSTAGRAGIEELQQQTIELMSGRSPEQMLFPRRVAFNLVPQVGEFLAGGATSEERRLVGDLRRLLNEPALVISVTRLRVPLFFGGALSVNLETDRKISVEEARDTLRAAPGVLLDDDLALPSYPTPADTVGQDATCVGRIREDETANVLDLWITIDNVRKGSAVNAVQIAELLIRDYL